MASYIRKPVSRTTRGKVREAGKFRDVVVTIRPPNIVGFRAKGCRTEYCITAEVGYMMGVRAHLADKVRQKKRVKRIKRKRR